MVIVAEVILIFHALMAMWAILAGEAPRTFAFHDAQRARTTRPSTSGSG